MSHPQSHVDGDIAHRTEQMGAPVVVATHPRSGTHLMIDLLRKQFEACKGWVWPWETLHHLYVNLDRIRPQSSHPLTIEKAVSLMQRPDRPTLKTHSRPGFREHPSASRRFIQRLIEEGTVVYVVRDGRDVLCSAYLWEQTHSDIQCQLSTFLRHPEGEPSRVRQWGDHVRAWTQQESVHVFRFEDILADARNAIRQLGTILDVDPLYETPYLPKRMESDSRWVDYWRRLTGNYESTTIVARPNGRSPPDWREAFTVGDRQFFWEEAGSMLQEFDYEPDSSWIEDPRTNDAAH